MFEDSLLERRISLGRRRGLTTTISFVVEFVLIGVLILIPLIYTEALPTHELTTYLVAPAPPPPPPPPAAKTPQPVRTAKKVVSEVSETGALRTPIRIPERVQMIKEEAPPPVIASTTGVVGGVPGGVPGGQLGGVIGGIIRATPVAHLPKAPMPKPVAPKRVRVSQGVTEGLLIHKVMPRYPQLARTARVQGTVVLSAIISKDGTIEKLQLNSGHPMLAPAAIQAVSQWRYRPYRLNGNPVEVETQITVNFSLAGG